MLWLTHMHPLWPMSMGCVAIWGQRSFEVTRVNDLNCVKILKQGQMSKLTMPCCWPWWKIKMSQWWRNYTTYGFGVKGHIVSFFEIYKMLFLFYITWYDHQTWPQESLTLALYKALTNWGQKSHRGHKGQRTSLCKKIKTRSNRTIKCVIM